MSIEIKENIFSGDSYPMPSNAPDNGMITRVAIAISGAPFPSVASRKKAYAAISAMRTPSKTVEAAHKRAWDQTPGEAWQATIDAILGEQGG